MKQQAWRDVIGFFFNCGVYYKMGRKNERFITRSFGGPHDSITKWDMWIILQSSKCSWLSKHFGPHLLDCNIIHISLDNGVMRTPKRCVTYLSFFFLVVCFNKSLLIKSLFDWFLFILFYLNRNDTFWIIFSGFQKIILLLSPRHYK